MEGHKIEWYIKKGYGIKGDFAYIVEFGRTNIITKVGKTSHLVRRMRQLEKEYGVPKIKMVYGFENEEDAYIMEVILHKYFKEKNIAKFIPQDRFKGRVFLEEDIPVLEKVADKIRNEKWF